MFQYVSDAGRGGGWGAEGDGEGRVVVVSLYVDEVCAGWMGEVVDDEVELCYGCDGADGEVVV